MKRIMFSLMVGMLVLLGSVGNAEATILFADDFSGFVDGQLNQPDSPWVAPWIDAGSRIYVGPATGYTAHFIDDTPPTRHVKARTAWVPGANTLGGVLQQDYIVRGTWWEDGIHSVHGYVAGRVANDGADKIVGGASINWPAVGRGPQDVWVMLEQRVAGARNTLAWARSATNWVPGEPLHLELKMWGDTAEVVATHAGVTTTIRRTATVINTGAPGFGGRMGWGYPPQAMFDDFEVAEIPEPATMILLGLGLGFAGLKGLKKKRA